MQVIILLGIHVQGLHEKEEQNGKEIGTIKSILSLQRQPRACTKVMPHASFGHNQKEKLALLHPLMVLKVVIRETFHLDSDETIAQDLFTYN